MAKEALKNSTVILLIEDNQSDAALIQNQLVSFSDQQFTVIWVERLSQGLEMIIQNNVDVVLLDLSLPDSDGLDTLKALLNYEKVPPVVVLTGSVDENRGIEAVRMGAQDYLIKGQAPSDVLTRSIFFAIERDNPEKTKATISVSAPSNSFVIQAPKFKVDFTKQLVTFQEDGKEQSILLTPIEFKIFVLLFQDHGNIATRGRIVAEIWGKESDDISIRTVDRHVSSLKKKCEKIGVRIHTVYGAGYKLETASI